MWKKTGGNLKELPMAKTGIMWTTNNDIVVVQLLSVSDSLWPCGLQHAKLPCPSLSPGVCSNSCLLSLWCYLIMILCAQSLQPCLTLWDPMDYSLPGSSVYGILQARILEQVVIPFFRGSSQPRDQTHMSALLKDSLPLSHQGSPIMLLLDFNP